VFRQPHWKPPHVGQRVRVINTKLEWLITELDGMVATLERRDRDGKHIEQRYNIQQILPVA
jgi:hypothetical protein